jgi:hypothetical protein
VICSTCDELDQKFIRPRNERSLRRSQGTLTPEIEAQLDAEERAALEAIQDHRAKDHLPGDIYG